MSQLSWFGAGRFRQINGFPGLLRRPKRKSACLSSTHSTRNFLSRIALPTVFGLLAVAALVLTALTSIVRETDRQDMIRSHQIAEGALDAFKAELEKNIADNAFWDDAANYVYNNLDPVWLMGTWGASTTGTAYYDAAYIVDHTGQQIVGYSDGDVAARSARVMFGSVLDSMVAELVANGLDATNTQWTGCCRRRCRHAVVGGRCG
jgi:sensor domain CHASE-containing protein